MLQDIQTQIHNFITLRDNVLNEAAENSGAVADNINIAIQCLRNIVGEAPAQVQFPQNPEEVAEMENNFASRFEHYLARRLLCRRQYSIFLEMTTDLKTLVPLEVGQFYLLPYLRYHKLAAAGHETFITTFSWGCELDEQPWSFLWLTSLKMS